MVRWFGKKHNKRIYGKAANSGESQADGGQYVPCRWGAIRPMQGKKKSQINLPIGRQIIKEMRKIMSAIKITIFILVSISAIFIGTWFLLWVMS